MVRRILTRHSLSVGLILMFFVTWTIELSNVGLLPFKVPFVVALTVGWAFIFISLLMTWLTLGKDEMARLFKRFFLWRVGWQWYLVAFLLLPALQSAAVLLTSWLTRTPTDYGHPMIRDVAPIDAPLLALVIPWLLFDMLTNDEEMGWRGYTLPRLQARHSALVASLLVGVIWGLWHLPKYLGSGMNSERSLVWFVVAHLALAILYTWLYNSTRGSLLLVTFFHASGNTAAMFLPVSFAVEGGAMQNLLILLIILAAVVVTAATGPARLSRTEEKQVQE